MNVSHPRRRFLKAALRTLAFGGLAGLGISLGLRSDTGQADASCQDTPLCGGCIELTRCPRTKARHFRQERPSGEQRPPESAGGGRHGR
ncbi:MAG: hypothetical protein KJ727_06300 [Acidobacteria bacterium]|nr:hypothetical protein [Acidobacteriota bacterium]MBU4254191.1 hypothetical protein [Acidobacteriota bacterium]MBU4329769.1 hypothetical protein [Acidobacteriota bacterium]MBU4493956.1 hypothetical protein [Acidobacteriota bacterium]MCG2816033.1 hypothetical protein [Candidatus Aminicenantes bacterium]